MFSWGQSLRHAAGHAGGLPGPCPSACCLPVRWIGAGVCPGHGTSSIQQLRICRPVSLRHPWKQTGQPRHEANVIVIKVMPARNSHPSWGTAGDRVEVPRFGVLNHEPRNWHVGWEDSLKYAHGFIARVIGSCGPGLLFTV